MDECKKIREVVPDLTNKIAKTLETVGGIHRSIEKLDIALNGNRPKCDDGTISPNDHEFGSIETLERMVENLYQSVNDADLELREKLNLLLGA